MLQRLGWGVVGSALIALACAVPALAQQTPSPAATPTPGATPAVTTTVAPSGSATAQPVATAATPPTPGTALSPTPTATAGTAPAGTDDIRALLLTEADIPAGLRPFPQMTGPMSMLNVQGYMVA